MAFGSLRVAAGLLLSCAVPFAVGSLLLRGFYSKGSVFLKPAWLRVVLAAGLGLGFSSILFFLWFPASFGRAGFFWELLVGAGLWFGARRLRPMRSGGGWDRPPATDSTAFRFLFYGMAAVTVFAFIRFMRHWPHGNWDAWSIWNLHARFLFRGGSHWLGLFSPSLSWSHPDYPYLLPSLVARGWSAAGRELLVVPQALATFFTAGVVALLVGAVSAFRDRNRGWLAGLALLAAPIFISNGSYQYADIPLSFFMLGTWVFAFDAWRRKPVSRTLVLAGGMAGLAAWTKNEGLCFCFLFLAVRFSVLAFRREWLRAVRETVLFLAGALPGLAWAVLFKIFAPPGDYTLRFGGVPIERLMDASRYRSVAEAFIRQVGRVDFWGIMPVALLLYAAVVGMNRKSLQTPEGMTWLLSVLGMGAAYFMAFVVSPYPLAWHLDTALARLLLQLWPTVLLGFFLGVRSADER